MNVKDSSNFEGLKDSTVVKSTSSSRNLTQVRFLDHVVTLAFKSVNLKLPISHKVGPGHPRHHISIHILSLLHYSSILSSQDHEWDP